MFVHYSCSCNVLWIDRIAPPVLPVCPSVLSQKTSHVKQKERAFQPEICLDSTLF